MKPNVIAASGAQEWRGTEAILRFLLEVLWSLMWFLHQVLKQSNIFLPTNPMKPNEIPASDTHRTNQTVRQAYISFYKSYQA